MLWQHVTANSDSRKLAVSSGKKFGSSEQCAGAHGVPDDREKPFGAPEAQISPPATQIWASAQTIFLSIQPPGPDVFAPPTH